MPSSPRVFVVLVIALAVLTQVLDIITNAVPDLLPPSLTKDPVVVSLLLIGLLLIVIFLTLGLRAAEHHGDSYVAPEVLKLFSAFAGIAIGVAVGLVAAPTVADFGVRTITQAYDFFTPASIRLEPLSGPPGTAVTISGRHFARDTPVIIFVEREPIGNVRTDEDGAFTFKLPRLREGEAEANNRLLKVSADDEDAKGYATATVLLLI